jgi:hypothetical protein
VTGGGRKLHNEELHNLHSSLNIFRINESRRIGWAEHVARMWTYRLLVEKPDRKRPLG